VGHCLTQFQDQSNLAFGRKGLFSLLMTCGIPRRLLEVFLSIATDSRYSSAGITKALKSAFGNDTSLFKSGSGGAKVAVVATTTNDSSTCIFTNYNGQEERSVKCGSSEKTVQISSVIAKWSCRLQTRSPRRPKPRALDMANVSRSHYYFLILLIL